MTAMPPASWNVPPGALTYGPPYYIASVGNGGFAYAYSDLMDSSVCVSGSAFCAAGMTGAATATTWGAGVGVNLNQTPNSTVPGTYAAPTASAGVTYALSSLPTGSVYMIIDNGGTPYFATLTAASGSIPWSMFKSTPWVVDASAPLGGPPQMATHLQIQLTAGTAASPFSFCAISLKIM
jgi:hypothetical protein